MSTLTKSVARFLSDTDYRRHLVEDPFRNWYQSNRSRKGIAPYPETITLYLTNQCNLRCRMCAQWGENGANFSQPKFYVDIPVIQKLFDEVAFYRPTILIMGGEPMLNKEWAKVIEMATERNIPTAMITNGMFLEKNAQTIVESGLSDLDISLDGPEEIHDYIRKSPGGYQKIMAGIEAVNRVKKNTGSPHPNFNIFFTITGMNYKNILDMAKELNGKRIHRLQIQHLWFVKEDTYKKHSEEFGQYFGKESDSYNGFVYEPGEFDPDILLNQLRELRNKSQEYEVVVNPAHPDGSIPDYYTNPHFERKALRDCQAIWSSITIGPQGEVSPCLDYYLGNIHTDKLLDIWNSEKMRYFRRVRKEHGPFPLCHRCCA